MTNESSTRTDEGNVSLGQGLPHNHDSDIYATARDETFWEMDRNLPRWARRSNPIVRRHLGGFLAAPLPQVDILSRLLLVQIGVVLVSFVLPVMLEFTALIGLVSLLVIPISLALYAGALFVIGRVAAEAMIAERNTQALDTLRTTPLTLRSILLSKIAAALWHQAVNLDTIILAVALFSLPVVTIEHATFYPPEKFPVVVRGLIASGLVVSVLRLVVEPFMVGAVGVLVGSIARMRFAAATWTSLLTAAYFALINLPWLGNLSWEARLIIETILPLALPILITLGALAAALYMLQRD